MIKELGEAAFDYCDGHHEIRDLEETALPIPHRTFVKVKSAFGEVVEPTLRLTNRGS
jgi:hypothetical protein